MSLNRENSRLFAAFVNLVQRRNREQQRDARRRAFNDAAYQNRQDTFVASWAAASMALNYEIS